MPQYLVRYGTVQYENDISEKTKKFSTRRETSLMVTRNEFQKRTDSVVGHTI
jgi:hypothetical protein